MRIIVLLIISSFPLCVFSQNLKFSYSVENPVPNQSKLVVYVQKTGSGTENVSAFNYGFYYKSTEATVQGFAEGATVSNMTPAQLANCVDDSYAEALDWAPNITGSISAVSPPAGLPSGYNRLFVGSIVDDNGFGSDIGTTPVPIIAVVLNNSIGSGPPSQDSSYMADAGNNAAMEYSTDFGQTSFPVSTMGQRLQPLPIVLVTFAAEKYNGTSALLSWTTSMEINSSHFTIQRSTDKKSWSDAGRVNATGNSHLIMNYSFLDENVYNGKDTRLQVYYRLALTDLDGKFEYSPMKSVVFGNVNTVNREVTVYPNPASQGVHVEWDLNNLEQPTTLEFFDINGKMVLSKKVDENSSEQYVDFTKVSMQPGLYVLRVMSGTEAIDHKQIIVGK